MAETKAKATQKTKKQASIKPTFNKVNKPEVVNYLNKAKRIIAGLNKKYADDKKYRLYSIPMNMSKAIEQSIKSDVKAAIESDIDFLNMAEGDLVDYINAALNENDYLAVAFYATIAEFVK